MSRSVAHSVVAMVDLCFTCSEATFGSGSPTTLSVLSLGDLR